MLINRYVKTKFHKLVINEDQDYIKIKVYDVPGNLLLKEFNFQNDLGFGFITFENKEVKQSNNNILSLLEV